MTDSAVLAKKLGFIYDVFRDPKFFFEESPWPILPLQEMAEIARFWQELELAGDDKDLRHTCGELLVRMGPRAPGQFKDELTVVYEELIR